MAAIIGVRDARRLYNIGVISQEELDHYKRLAAWRKILREGANEVKLAIYNRHRIAWELERTAMGDGFYGNALRVAKDVPGVTDQDRSLLDRYATGKAEGLAERLALCELAMRIDQTKEEALAMTRHASTSTEEVL